MRRTRITLGSVLLALTAGVGGWTGTAVAQDLVTGCLNSGGALKEVAQGEHPLRLCRPNQTPVTLGGGDGTSGPDGVSCSVEALDEGARLTCTDGTDVTFEHGGDGPSGVAGDAGPDGRSCGVLRVDGGAVVTCTDGTEAPLSDGASGGPGASGETGPDGSSCTVTQVTAGAVITCSDGAPLTVLHGANGSDATTRAGQACPPGQLVVGFDPNGILCAN